MILDCFMFTNEYDILEGRLEYLYPKVDKFIIIESDITHNGTKKRLNFLDNIKRYTKYMSKIFYYPVHINPDHYDFTLKPDDPASRDTGYWKVENFQRNYIQNALNFFDDDDIVMISDVDEIPLKSAIDIALVHLAPDNPFIGFKQGMFFYNFNQVQQTPCYGTVLCKNYTVKDVSPQWIREHRWDHQIPFVEFGGYHLSFWATPEKIQQKIIIAPHQEFNNEKIRDLDNIRHNMIMGKDIYERKGKVLLPVDRNTIDPEVLTIFEKYEIII